MARNESACEHPTPRELLLRICEEVLKSRHCTDSHLGPIAVAAASLQNSSILLQAMRKLVNGFDCWSYHLLGTILSLQEPLVSEDE